MIRLGLQRLAALLLLLTLGCDQLDRPQVATPVLVKPNEIQKIVDPQLAQQIVDFCSDCHVPPDASTFAKHSWPEEVARGFSFYEISGRHDLLPPEQQLVTQYYQSLAPDSLELPEPESELDSSPIQFTRQRISSPGGKTRPGISDLLATEDGLYCCDMHSGKIALLTSDSERRIGVRNLTQVQAPTHVELAEFAGGPGLLIADLGNFQGHHLLGGVYFAPFTSLEKPITILKDVGRIANATQADFNGDGKLDIAVAEFGWHESGSMHLLLNHTTTAGDLQFEKSKIDDRNGASHIVAVDFDDDGDQDMIVLHSQEHEMVELYENDGTAHFTTHTMFAANVPDYGCSSLEVADIDGDGDLDVLLSNGDSMDSYVLKPHHGVQWIENLGEHQFQVHLLQRLPGVYGATLGDLDGDGDLDIAACTMTWDSRMSNTLVWFEQTAHHQFKQHCLDLSIDQHACLELGDFDGDGRLDIAVGEFEGLIELDEWVSIWWNDGPASGNAASVDSATASVVQVTGANSP